MSKSLHFRFQADEQKIDGAMLDWAVFAFATETARDDKLFLLSRAA